MQPFKKQLLVYLFILFLSNIVYAQGSLKGTVTDGYDDEPLIGVSVFIVGTSMGTASDADGKFLVRRIPSGDIQVRFSYVGYETQVFDVTIVDGETQELNVSLSAASITGDVVEISAQAMGQVAAMNQQRSSNSIVNVVSEEKIRELPDANAAESIGRLSGVSLVRSGGEANKVVLRGMSDKYLSITVDGVRLPATDALARGVDLSAISQNSLSGIELYKSLTPDKDADAIAGTINLVTRKAPENAELRITAKGGYNQIRDSYNQYDLSARYGQRYLNGLLGVQVMANAEKKIRNNEQISIGYTNPDDAFSNYWVNNLDLEYVNEDRKRQGAGVILDFNTPDDGNIKLNTMYNSTTRDYLTHTRNYPFGDNVYYEYRDREQQIDVLSAALNGDNYLFGIKTNWSASISRSKSHFPYDYAMTFYEPSVTGSSGMMSGIPEVKDDPSALIDFAYNNFQTTTLFDAYYRTQENEDTEFSTYLDLEKEYTISSNLSGSLKAGGKYRTKNRVNERGEVFSPYYLGSWTPYQPDGAGGVGHKDYQGTSFEDYFIFNIAQVNNNMAPSLPSLRMFLSGDPESKVILGDYDMNPLIIKDVMREWYTINGLGRTGQGTPEYHEDITAGANDYDITESVSAAYIMNTLKIGASVTAILGLRVEQENHDYKNKYSPRQIGGFPVPVGAVMDTTSTYSETVVLPHAHVNIAPTDFLNLRFAAYKALARPDFNMRLLSYFPWREATTGGDNVLVLGNPILETAKAWNYEVNASLYGNELGLFSVSLYYKEIEDMYHQLSGFTTSGDSLIKSLGLDWDVPFRANTGYSLSVPYNSNDVSKVWGLEIDHQINFYWLPGLLKNIVLSYNASWVRSETPILGQRTDTTYTPHPVIPGVQVPSYKAVPDWKTARLESQPDFFGNVSLGYDIGGFSGRVSAFHQGEYFRSYNPRGNANRLVGKFTRVDIALTYKATEFLTLVGNVNNITNVEEKDIQDNAIADYRALRQAERYGITFDLGVRIDL